VDRFRETRGNPPKKNLLTVRPYAAPITLPTKGRKAQNMKKSNYFKLLLTFIGGPAAGAFGLFLMSEAPMIHRAICMAGAG